jgi:formate--tetrahydrofolate ligase
VDYTARAKRDREQLEKLGFGKLPVCIAKTQQSLSDNPALLGRPKDFLVTVREIQLAAGAGFVIPITGEIMRMPGLPKEPLAGHFDLSADGEVVKI